MNCTRFITALSVALLAVAIPQAKASVSEAQALRIAIGEASNQGEMGMQAVCEVLRRRGSIRGFYGYRAKHVDQQPAWVWAQAKRAWVKSGTSNLTRGADHFESVDFKIPAWAKNRLPVSTIGKHRFYRLNK